MGILEEIKQMQSQNKTEEEITRTLKEKGASPKEISDSFDQAKIKSAVSNEEYYQPPETQESSYAPQAQEAQEQVYAPQEQYQQDSYENYSPGGIDTDTTVEIAEQVFQERSAKMQNQLNNLNEIKTLLQSTVDDLSERLKRIETTIDKLQISILDKVGSYGKNLESIKKEMGMMQDSFGKMSNEVANKKTARTTTTISQPTKLVKKVSKRN